MVLEFISGSWALFLLRLILAQVFILHGLLKIQKKEADGTSKYILLGVIEFIAGIMILLGFFTDIASISFIVIMLGAIFMKLFIWPRQSYKSNIEYDVLILLASLVILVLGPGAFTI